MRNREITVNDNLEELSRTAARRFVELAQIKINTGQSFTVALAGGSTPKRLYELLADENEPFCRAVDWAKVNFFWGDERCVAPDADTSNYRMARRSLLEPLGIAPENIHRFKSELDPQTAAADYEKTLRTVFGASEKSFPRFDLILLGMGADGHTASLFPQTDVLRESEKLAVAPFVEKFGAFRLTLTPPILNQAENVIFQVAGADKAVALREVLHGVEPPDKFPAKLINPTAGNVFWLIDKAAAQSLAINR